MDDVPEAFYYAELLMWHIRKKRFHWLFSAAEGFYYGADEISSLKGSRPCVTNVGRIDVSIPDFFLRLLNGVISSRMDFDKMFGSSLNSVLSLFVLYGLWSALIFFLYSLNIIATC